MPIIGEGPDDPFGTYSGCIHVVVENPNCRIRPRVVPEISAGADNGVRIMWDHDGEEHIETVALGWTANTPTFAYRTALGRRQVLSISALAFSRAATSRSIEF